MTISNFKQPTMTGIETPPAAPAVLITIEDLATILGCSTRHVHRLVNSNRIPRPIKLGALRRWIKADIDQWIAAGCPNCRKGGVK
jgi:excisionase family DNA binding protein